MRRIIIALFAVATSFSIHAADITSTKNDLNTAINKSVESQTGKNRNSTMVYGGKDISRSILASARENKWTTQENFIG